jgi:hypothetical protein
MENQLTNIPLNNSYSIQTNKTINQISVLRAEDEKIYGDLTIADVRNSRLSDFQKEVLLAKYSEKPVKELDPNYVGERVRGLINNSILVLNFKVDNLSQVIIEVIKDIFIDFGNNTLSEIALAYRLGSRKKLGDFMGISVATFYGWLNTYNETIRLESFKVLQAIKKDEIPVNEEKKKEYHIKWLQSYIKDFERYKNGEELQEFDFGNVFYKYCIKNGIGYINDDEMAILNEKAKENLKINYTSKKSKDPSKAKEYKEIIDILESETINEYVSNKIKSDAKRLAIPVIFKRLIKRNIDLYDMICKIENKTIQIE